MDEEESNGEPFDHDGVAALSIIIEASSVMPTATLEVIPTELVTTEPVTVVEPTPVGPTIRPGSPLAKETTHHWEDAPKNADPSKKVKVSFVIFVFSLKL